MRKLDFISSGPQLSIFQEDANKNNLGGTLYFIHIIILIILAILYIADYSQNEKYEFNYNYIRDTYNESEFKDGINSDKENLNYDLDFKFQLGKDYDNNIIDLQSSRCFLNFEVDDEFYDDISNANTRNFHIYVLYNCRGLEKCSIQEEDKFEKRSYFLNIFYKGFTLNHQDPESPLKKSNEFSKIKVEFLANTNIVFLYWGEIEYEEEKNIFEKTYDKIMGKNNTYYGGDFKSMEIITDDGHVRNSYDGETLVLLYLEIHPDYLQHDKYTRKKHSFLDVSADISALSSTVLDLMALAYGFLYSQNYDNYKIVETILSKKMRLNIDNKIEEKEETKIELKTDLIDNDIDEKEKIDEEKNIEEDKIKKKGSINLPFMRFYDFLVHQFYFKCFGPSKRQALIDSCNDVVAKYTTVENLIYNQIIVNHIS